MPTGSPLADLLRKMLKTGDLTFSDFMEIALYHPDHGYYGSGENRVGKEGDYVTGPTLSPVFGASLGGLVREFLSRGGGVT